MSNKPTVMYIASTSQASEFKSRCQPLFDDVNIATLGTFGKENPHDSFMKMSKIMRNGGVEWTIFHWKDVSELIGGQVFLKEIKELIGAGACKRSKTFIIDPEGTLSKKDGVNTFAAFGIGVVPDETDIGMPFAKMLTNTELELKKAVDENKAFEGIVPPDYSKDDGRLPGMSTTTPSHIEKEDNDPFADLGTHEENDPFASIEKQSYDPFADFENFDDASQAPAAASGTANAPQSMPQSAPQSTGDIFSELDDDLGEAFEPDDLGNGADDIFDDDLFEVLEQQADETIANAGDVDDPFADFNDVEGAGDFLGGTNAFDDGDPFAGMENDMIELDKSNGVNVEDFIGGIGGVMDGTSVSEDVVGADVAAENAPATDDDPFADFDLGEGFSAGSDGVEDGGGFDTSDNDDDVVAAMFDDIAEDGNIFADDEEDVFDDPFGEMSEEDIAIAKQSAAGGGAIVPANESNSIELAPAAGAGDPFAGKSTISLDDIFEYYGSRLGVNDYNKLVGMLEPEWDYSMEAADGIGLAGGGAKGLLGGGRKAKNTYSQVEEYTLAESLYIRDMEEHNERYAPPDKCKVILSHSPKGGSGKSVCNSMYLMKALPDGTPQRTTIGKIRPGDCVFNRLGQPVEVESVSPQGKLDVYEITLRDGRVIQCSGDHLWNVLQRGSNRSKDHHRNTYTTKELMEKSIYKNEGKGKQEYRWKIPVNEALEYPEQDLPIDPYLLGLLIGDGCLLKSSPEISSADMEIIEAVDSIVKPMGLHCYKNKGDNYTWLIVEEVGKNTSTNPLKQALHDMMLWCCKTEDKFIPEEYMIGSIEQRRALLQGLMDSDGCSNKGRFSFSTINDILKDQFMSLVRSLGYTCSVSLDNRTEKYTTGECWNVRIQTNDVENIFRLQRKKDEYYAYKAKQTPAKTLPKRNAPTLYTEADNNGLAPLDIADAPIDPYLLGMMFSRRKVQHDKPLCMICRNDFIVGRVIESFDQSDLRFVPEAWAIPSKNGVDSSYIFQQKASERAINKKTALHKLLSEHGVFNDENAAWETRMPTVPGLAKNKGEYERISKEQAAVAIAASAVRARQVSDIEYTDFLGIHIPDAYMHGTPELRQALLQGIMDGAGVFAPSAALPAVNTQRNPQFRAQFEELVENLGYSLHESTAKSEVEFTIIATDDTSVFYSEEFIEEMHNIVDTKYQTKANTWMGNDDRYVSIVDIKKTDRKEEMTCIYVKDEEHLFLVGDYIVTHNSSIAVGLATQLNWYFNKELMQQMTTNYRSRVLLLSLNEFDDIPVHGIGYDGFDVSQDEDGRNVAELLRRIEDTNGNPTWDDIMHCFVSTEQNRVFYLPSLTQREILADNINITANDYKRVFEVCSKFFQFIIVDTPDIFYQEKNDLMNFVFAVADIICMIVEPDARSVTNLYHFFNGLEVETGRVPLNPAKCLLVVNKYVLKNNPYIVQPIDQLSYEDITKGTSRYFARAASIPFTQPRGTGNVLYGTDPKVKEAYADLADTVLDMIAQNDAEEEQKKKKRK